jgi:hypothetical protein
MIFNNLTCRWKIFKNLGCYLHETCNPLTNQLNFNQLGASSSSAKVHLSLKIQAPQQVRDAKEAKVALQDVYRVLTEPKDYRRKNHCETKQVLRHDHRPGRDAY